MQCISIPECTQRLSHLTTLGGQHMAKKAKKAKKAKAKSAVKKTAKKTSKKKK